MEHSVIQALATNGHLNNNMKSTSLYNTAPHLIIYILLIKDSNVGLSAIGSFSHCDNRVDMHKAVTNTVSPFAYQSKESLLI